MSKKTISISLALFLVLLGLLCAEGIQRTYPGGIEKLKKIPCEINVTSPAYNQWCYTNNACPIVWDTSNIPSGGTVYLHVIQVDAEHIEGWEGPGYPVQNTGSYQWIVPENVGPLDATCYQIKVITPDQKCSGKSRVFGIKKGMHPIPKMPVPLQR
jgi:hypothetical protein